MLLVGGSLAVRSFEQLTRVSPGFDPRGVLTFTLSLPSGVYKDDSQVAAFYRDLVGRLERVPGARSAAAVMIPPVSTSGFSGTFSIDSRPDATGPDEPRAQMRPITPGYFSTLGIPLVRGQFFDGRDDGAAAPVALVSETAARRFWPRENPVGHRLRMHVSATGGHQPQPFREIVGVVRDVKHGRLDLPAAPMVYIPHAQHAASWMALVVRTSLDPASLQAAVADAVRKADRTLVPLEMQPFEARLAASRAEQRFRALLLGLFAGAAFVLAVVGLYAVVAYTTSRRRHELGIRLVVGASAGQIVRLVVRDGMRPVAAGVAIGCVGAAGVSRLMRSMLFGTRPFEPALVAGVATVFVVAALVACYLPARRATALDPSRALRSE